MLHNLFKVNNKFYLFFFFYTSFQFGFLQLTKAAIGRCFSKKGIYKSFQIFTWKHLLIKLQAWNPELYFKKIPTCCFPVNIAKFLRTAFYIKHLRWLLLSLINAKSTATTSIGFVLVSLLLTLNIFYSFVNHSVFPIHFEQVNAGSAQTMYVSSRLKSHLSNNKI